MRATWKDCENLVAWLNRNLPRTNGYSYQLDSAYGKRSLIMCDSKQAGCRTISPLLSPGQLYTWIQTYKAGIEEHEAWLRSVVNDEPLTAALRVQNMFGGGQ